MSDAMEIAHAVLRQLGDLLRKLPPEVLNDLYEGTATLEIVPKGGRRAPTKKQPELTVDVAQVKADLDRIDDRAAATRYVEDLKLTVAMYVELARQLNISVPSKARKAEAIQQIVQWTVGRRLTAEAISRPAPSRF